MSMLLEEFLENLGKEERSHFEMLYDSDPSSKEDDDLVDRLCNWYSEKIRAYIVITHSCTLTKLHSVHLHCPSFPQGRKDE